MKDYRNIVPRTPPDGLKKEATMGLDTHGLLYEVVWVEEDLMGPILEERKPRKIKMVRVRCSACGGECILPWAEDNGIMRRGYGFLHPGEQWMDGWGIQEGEPTKDGDATLCPLCNSPVMAIKAAGLNRNGWKVTSENDMMSASILDGGELVLTGWRFQIRVYRDGHEEVASIPLEAYIFDGTQGCKLTGWVNAYSGTAGYYIQPKKEWGQPKEWRETWGSEEYIYGLTKDLLESSSVENCKLIEYMETRRISKAYPVAYLMLWQRHSNVENLVISGLPLVVSDLIREVAGGYQWKYNERAEVELDEIDWEERAPSKMLGLNREELRLAQRMGWGATLWRLYLGARETGELLSEENLRNVFYLGDEDVLELVGSGPVGKSVAYLLRQIELYGENEETDPYVVVEEFLGVQTLLDYWNMCEALGMDLSDNHVRFPRNLCQAHDQVMERQRERKNELLEEKFRERAESLERYAFQWDGLTIRAAASQQELNDEGKQLGHCVGTYADKHASGRSSIFFIRHANNPGKSYFTLELDEEQLKVLQNRGKGNCARTKEVEEFEALWLSWLRAGCKRNKDGEPVLPDKKEMCA